jgi:hypothetical protein
MLRSLLVGAIGFEILNKRIFSNLAGPRMTQKTLKSPAEHANRAQIERSFRRNGAGEATLSYRPSK